MHLYIITVLMIELLIYLYVVTKVKLGNIAKYREILLKSYNILSRYLITTSPLSAVIEEDEKPVVRWLKQGEIDKFKIEDIEINFPQSRLLTIIELDNIVSVIEDRLNRIYTRIEIKAILLTAVIIFPPILALLTTFSMGSTGLTLSVPIQLLSIYLVGRLR